MPDPEHNRDSTEDRKDAGQQPATPDANTSQVRQDEALTNAERLPRRGDHEIPPGTDTSV